MFKKTASVLALLMLALGILLYFQTQKLNPEGENPRARAINLILQFQNSQPAQGQLNMGELREGLRAEQYEPNALLPKSHLYPYQEIRALEQYTHDCIPLKTKLTTTELIKAYQWEQWFHCRKLKHLPDNFWQTGSLMHPFGQSYAFLSRDQIPDLTNFMHLLELKELSPKHNRYPKVFYELDTRGLWSLLQSEFIVINQDSVYLLANTNVHQAQETYYYYAKKDLEQFLRDTPFLLNAQRSNCFYAGSSFCFQYNQNSREHLRSILLIFMGLSFVLLISLLLHSLYRTSVQRKQAREQQVFVMQMLAHEIRTPVTSMTLTLESLRSQFDQLPEKSKDDFFNFSRELAKLKQIIEASRRYLSSNNPKRNFQLQKINIESINQFIHVCLERLEKERNSSIIFHQLEQDLSIQIDPYWLELVLKILVENAFDHGTAPVQVSLTHSGKTITLAIKDAGISSLSLDQMTEPFFKGKHSQGMGLGLNIAQKIILDMQGRLSLSANPTQFLVELDIIP